MSFFKFRKNSDARQDKSLLSYRREGIYTDAYRTLCANIQHIMDEQQLSTLLITSALNGEGKTTTAINLGTTFAREGKSVLLINADWRNHDVNHLLKIPSDASGLSECLDSGFDGNIEDNVILLKESKIAVLPYGQKKDVPIGKIKRVIDQLKENYDLIIVLSSAVSVHAETALLAKDIDATLLVVKQDETSADEINAAVQELKLAGANLIGTVFSHYHTLQNRKYLKKYKRLYQK